MTHARANRHRGEIEVMINGERRILCLTLGALAELETAFAADNLMELASRFASGRLKASDMIAVLGAGLRGGGNLVSDEDVAVMNLEGGVAGMAKIVIDLLSATFAPDAASSEATSPNPTMPQPAEPSRSPSRGRRSCT
jgi:hypothetical protein